jgi:hypothetical protein
MNPLDEIARKSSSAYLHSAIDKARSGERLTGNEQRRIDRALSGVHSAPFARPSAPADPIASRRPLQPEEVENLEARLRNRARVTAEVSSDVIALLLASGATFVEKTGCNSGTPYTYWAPEWTSDPS